MTKGRPSTFVNSQFRPIEARAEFSLHRNLHEIAS